ncbi:glycerol-3-phosphate dehydrogenase [Sinisalibacter aestuarii]|uniref:Glycerol-3-phosphate dehydrogenase n=1 Tax=Sinisalibacter aestuarii TaxID=2949426 RepID=A0ABQ5LTY6_9RHOB|nr:glycerol-3-phosphate dehydrogenase [Sinisalibacter aestuarii]GKY88422.1 glycerol-3-phosphate dehydrogenase [Sinisalibacter aestuarii]
MGEADTIYDLFVIGGGVNGCGIARDAAGRGLSVALAEMGDLGGATSSASSKLFHGGLRYLEYYEFRLVREALREREVLLAAMPHIARPMRFVLPHHKGLRPHWLLRLGLFLYDHLGGRKILPATRRVDLRRDPAGEPLQDRFTAGFEYSDCWVDDARLVVLNARDAAMRGARIMTRAKVTRARRHGDVWEISVEDQRNGATAIHRARRLVNAAGPWVAHVLDEALALPDHAAVRLVRGSHIVVPRIFDHGQPYILQGGDGRIVFAMPYEQDYTLIGTTEADQGDDPADPRCSEKEAAYLCAFVSEYFDRPVTLTDVVWRFSGVRPLVDDGASSATEATRDYVLTRDGGDGAPLLNVFGGKITTYRKLAEAALAKLDLGDGWTAQAPLPGGDFPVDGLPALIAGLRADYPFLTEGWAARLARLYGTEARAVLGNARAPADLGRDFGATLTEAELGWMADKEFAETAEDALWRRTKLGLQLDETAARAVARWFDSRKEAA